MYLYFTISWLVIAAAILTWHALDPDTKQGRIAGVSMGWIALVMGLYSLARWWHYRSAVARRRAEREAREALERRQRQPRAAKEPEPDSPFRFDEMK